MILEIHFFEPVFLGQVLVGIVISNDLNDFVDVGFEFGETISIEFTNVLLV